MSKYHVISCHVLWRELCYFASQSKNVFNFDFLKQGLHNTPEILRQELQLAVDRVPDNEYDAILVGYGLCSRGIEGIVARKHRLVVMRGHDCITFLLGSKERYQEYFEQHPGTYWYSPGWIDCSLMPGKERYEHCLRHYTETYGDENAQYLMEAEQGWFQKYSNAAYTDLGCGETEHYREYTRRCADWLGWNCDVLQGDPRLMVDFLEGHWNEENFLMVEPGETIVASHDGRIIEARPQSDLALHRDSPIQ
ncbi:MAG: DUF1638 domain-containing protein [Candidatus Hydrogenedentes bacterium]|nr:DUF1638 domain-containing protein [Candidatus Hydrogenedentota bacterium]